MTCPQDGHRKPTFSAMRAIFHAKRISGVVWRLRDEVADAGDNDGIYVSFESGQTTG